MACGAEEGKPTPVELDTVEEVAQQKTNLPASADASFADGMVGAVFQNYLLVRDALVQTDASRAAEAAEKLARNLMDAVPAAQQHAQAIAASNDIEAQRSGFEELTKALGPLFKKQLKAGTIYEQYCPMAFDNRGASWYSEVQQIANPYFGDRMLRCGRVTAVIER